MPRTGRKHSGTGIYHVMLRGINRQDIFEEPEDHWELERESKTEVPAILRFYGDKNLRPGTKGFDYDWTWHY